MLAIETEFRQFFDLDGSPLDAGYLYIGTAGQNPETSPVTVYWDIAGTQPAAQPIRTLNGYPVRNGTPANLFIATDYAMTVKSKTGALIYTAAQSALYAMQASITAAATAAATAERSPVIGGSTTSSVLELRSTSGAGTSLPATTGDYIRFTRGNNGNRELGRFTPGGSFGIGDYTDGMSVNVHAGDDGTTTRVATVRAATAALFIGATDRTNAEAGGPIGRSVVSFEGYRMANANGSRESGAVRVITEGVSTTQLGARVSILTRRDGFDESDFFERWSVSNDGNVYHGGGNGGVGGANRSNYAYGNTVYTISGSTGRAVLEFTTNQADADGVVLGDQSWIGNFQTDEKRVALIQGVLSGATATKRGGQIRHYLKPDNGSLTETLRETPQGLKLAGPVGALQAASTLTISGNAIAPTLLTHFVGAGLIKNITVPAHMVSHGGRITLIPTAAFTTDATGNIALASTAVVGKFMDFVYDGGTGKWYPSY